MKLAILVLCVAMLVTLPFIYAQALSTYTIALEGGRWTHYTITVKIQPPAQNYFNTKFYQDLVVRAFLIWNRALQEFTNTYYPRTHIYNFTETTTSPDVTVNLVFGTISNKYQGMTFLSNGIGTKIALSVTYDTQGKLKINSDLFIASAKHEVGHVLGLGHTALLDDIMYNGSSGFVYNAISTLDAYAVYYLAYSKGSVPASITLPSNIDYDYIVCDPYSCRPIPEFPVANSTLLISLLASTSIVIGLRSKKRKTH
jgi:hypothetical protein